MEIRIDTNLTMEEMDSGTVVGDGEDFYLIIYMSITQKYMLMDIETGIVLYSEYDSIEELKANNKELIRVQKTYLTLVQ